MKDDESIASIFLLRCRVHFVIQSQVNPNRVVGIVAVSSRCDQQRAVDGGRQRGSMTYRALLFSPAFRARLPWRSQPLNAHQNKNVGSFPRRLPPVGSWRVHTQLRCSYHLLPDGVNDYGLPIAPPVIPTDRQITPPCAAGVHVCSFPENLFGRGILSTFVLVSLSPCFTPLGSRSISRGVASDGHPPDSRLCNWKRALCNKTDTIALKYVEKRALVVNLFLFSCE